MDLSELSDLCKPFVQIESIHTSGFFFKRNVFLHTCAPCSELPYGINTTLKDNNPGDIGWRFAFSIGI